MKKLETILGLSVLIAIVLKINLLPFGSILLMLSILILAIIYYPLGFALFNEIRLTQIFKKTSYKGLTALRIIGSILAGSSFSLICAGVLFKLNFWSGAQNILFLGLISTLIILILVLIKYFKTKSNFYKQLLIRILIIGGIGLITNLVSDLTIIKIQYRNHPDYIKAYELYKSNPQDELLNKNLKLEYFKATMSKEEYEVFLKNNENQ